MTCESHPPSCRCLTASDAVTAVAGDWACSRPETANRKHRISCLTSMALPEDTVALPLRGAGASSRRDSVDRISEPPERRALRHKTSSGQFSTGFDSQRPGPLCGRPDDRHWRADGMEFGINIGQSLSARSRLPLLRELSASLAAFSREASCLPKSCRRFASFTISGVTGTRSRLVAGLSSAVVVAKTRVAIANVKMGRGEPRFGVGVPHGHRLWGWVDDIAEAMIDARHELQGRSFGRRKVCADIK